MGTNFYIRGFRRDDNPDTHIGKRSASGSYCWDCDITLCKQGNEGIHQSSSEWYDKCPRCKKGHEKEGLEKSSAGRELGFNRTPPGRKKGVASACSFTWGINPNLLKSVISEHRGCPSCHREYADEHLVIEDEYGNLYTRTEFEGVLDECPIVYTNMIGQYFS